MLIPKKNGRYHDTQRGFCTNHADNRKHGIGHQCAGHAKCPHRDLRLCRTSPTYEELSKNNTRGCFMKMPARIEKEMLAPCGVLCLACSAYLHKTKPCPGCRAPQEAQKRKSCMHCAKKKCAFDRGYLWCFACERFPCARIKDLSKRYNQNHDVDLIQNGLAAREDMRGFLAAQRARFLCSACGGIMDQHHQKCSECGCESRP